MKIKAILGAGVTMAALATTQLDAAALTTGTALASGNGSTVIVTGIANPPSLGALKSAEELCISNFISSIPPIESQVRANAPLLDCMLAGLGTSSYPSVSAGGTWAGVTKGGSFTVAMTCQAAASVGILTVDAPVTTTVSACYLLGKTDGLTYAVQPPTTLPGATSAVSAVAISVPVQNYAVCVAGDAHYLNGTIPSTGGTGCF